MARGPYVEKTDVTALRRLIEARDVLATALGT